MQPKRRNKVLVLAAIALIVAFESVLGAAFLLTRNFAAGATTNEVFTVLGNNPTEVVYTGLSQRVVTNLPAGMKYAISTEDIALDDLNAYTKVEYLATNRGYVDTLFTPNQDTRLTMTTLVTGLSDNGTLFYGAGGKDHLTNNFEAYIWHGRDSVIIPTEAARITFNYASEPDYYLGEVFTNTLIYIDQNKNVGSYTINGEFYTHSYPYQNFTCPLSLYLFNLHRIAYDSSSSLLSEWQRIYECKMYDNDRLCAILFPCVKLLAGTWVCIALKPKHFIRRLLVRMVALKRARTKVIA